MTGSTATVEEAEATTFVVPSQRSADTPTLPFKIEDPTTGRTDTFVLRQPKMSIAMGMVQLVEQREEYTTQDFGLRLSHLLWSFIAYVAPGEPEPETIEVDGEQKPNPYAGLPTGRGRLLMRLNDADDALDIMDLEPMFNNMINRMFDRPTGPSPESPNTPGDGGTDSEAATPAPPAKKSGNSHPASSSPPRKTSAAKAGKRS